MRTNCGKWWLIVFCIGLFSPVSAQFIKDVYRFNNNLSVSPPDCGPDLVPTIAPGNCTPVYASGGKYENITIPYCGITRPIYQNFMNWGLKYPNTQGTITTTYTIHIYLRSINWGTHLWTRIIDFSNGLSDNGIYFKNQAGPNRCLDFYPNGIVGPCPYFNDTTWYLLTFTRDGNTKMMYVYVNNTLFASYNDASNTYTSVAGKPVYIYRDDQVVPCEAGEADFAYLSFTNAFSTQATVDSVYNDICSISSAPISANFSLTPLPACLNQNMTVNYAGDIPAPGTGYTFNWNWGGANVISGSGMGPYVINWSTPGTHTIDLTVTNNTCGSQNASSQQIDVFSPLTTTINQTICAGQSYQGYTTSGIYIDTFNSDNGCDSIRTLNLTVLITEHTTYTQTICFGQSYNGHTTSGSYFDTLTAVNGCDSVIQLNLYVVPAILSTENKTICTGQSYLGYSTMGTYIDTFQIASGCDSIRTLNLTVVPGILAILNKTICEGQSYAGHSTAGIYVDTVHVAGGCDSIRTLNLSLTPKPKPDLGPDKSICTGDSILLKPGSFPSYLWQDGSTSNYFIAKQAGVYSVTVTDSCGAGTDNIIITKKDCTPYFPSAFTPNQDGKNDLFKVLNGFNLKEFSLSVYNRWGQKVFETSNPSVGWNGTLQGQRQDAGVFVWFSNFKLNNQEYNLKGTVVLIR
jgi:gliding motility-associated-like protein